MNDSYIFVYYGHNKKKSWKPNGKQIEYRPALVPEVYGIPHNPCCVSYSVFFNLR